MARWFSHDSNARNSKKLFRVRQRYGAAGYGVYFMLVEMLRDADENRLDLDYDMLSFDIREDAELIKHIVEDFGLFRVAEDGLSFVSDGLAERLSTDYRSEAGKKGAEARWGKMENGHQMAQNGKIDGKPMASDGKPCEAMPIVTVTKELQKDKETCCCSNESTVADESKCFSFSSLSEEQRNDEQQRIYEIFFFKDFKNPKSEVDKFIEHNEKFGWIPKGRTEALSTPDQRVAWAHGWTVKTQPRTGRQDFLVVWKKFYETCARSDPALARLMLDPRTTIGKVAGGRCYIRCAEPVWRWIEDNCRNTHPAIRPLFNGENWVYFNL